MKNTLFAGNSLLIIFGLLFIFHCLVLFGLIPYDIVWAGKIKNHNELVKMESISLLVLIVFSTVVVLKMRYLKYTVKPIIINVGMWVLVAFFALNTLGNLTAINPIEKYGFGLLTAVITLLALRLAVKNKLINHVE